MYYIGQYRILLIFEWTDHKMFLQSGNTKSMSEQNLCVPLQSDLSQQNDMSCTYNNRL